MAKYTLKSEIASGLSSIMSNAYYGLGAILFPIFASGMTGINEMFKSMPIPDPNQSSNDYFQLIFAGIEKRKAGEKQIDPVALLLYIIVGVWTAFKTPMDIAGILSERQVMQDVKAKIQPALPDISILIAGLFRDLIKDEQVTDLLLKHGFRAEHIDLLKKTAEFIPSATDVIRFAVREAYTPSIAEKFGQYDEGENVYAHAEPDIKATGMSKDNFMKYWAAHWDLPSPTQGFEMLHRGIIDENTLKQLLRALDVMPFWRDKFIQMSYNPLTRVDVRRMYKMGLLTIEEMTKAYMDIGYNQDNADKLATFTIEWANANADEDKTDTDRKKEQVKDLTKSDILQAYGKKLINLNTAGNYLQQIGYDINEADFLLARLDLQDSYSQNEAYLKFYKEAYITGLYDKTKITELFGKLNLPAVYQEYLFKIWDIELEVKSAIPTKTELFNFFRRGTITEEQLKAELRKRKYQEAYINWYIGDLKREVEE